MRGNLSGLLIVLMLMPLLVGCTKEDPIRHYKIEQETREWTAFKPGSYWIFESEDGQRTDSTYVASCTESETVGYDTYGNKCKAQQLVVTFKTAYGWYNSRIENTLPRGNFVKIETYNPSGRPMTTVDMVLLFPLDFIDPNNTLYFEVIADNAQVSIGKEVLSNVVHVRCRVNGLDGSLAGTTYDNEYWIAKNRWMVKMKTKNPQTGGIEVWNLKRLHVVQ